MDHLVCLESFIREAFTRRKHVARIFLEMGKAYETKVENHGKLTWPRTKKASCLNSFRDFFWIKRFLSAKIYNGRSKNPARCCVMFIFSHWKRSLSNYKWIIVRRWHYRKLRVVKYAIPLKGILSNALNQQMLNKQLL